MADPMMLSDDERAARYNAEAREPQLTPEQLRRLEQMRAERKMREAMGRAYDESIGPGLDIGRAPKRKLKAYKNGGYVRAADGCAQRGKTKGKMV